MLVIAFRPFAGRSHNTALDVARALGVRHVAVDVSVDGVESGIRQTDGPVVWLGEAPLPAGVDFALETRAVNDTEGAPIDPGRPTSATRAWRGRAPAGVVTSTDAGNFYCNRALWRMLEDGVNGCFVHVARDGDAARIADALKRSGLMGDTFMQGRVPRNTLNQRMLHTRKGALEQLRASGRAIVAYHSPTCMPCRFAMPTMNAYREALHQAQIQGFVPDDVKFRFYDVTQGGAPVDAWPALEVLGETKVSLQMSPSEFVNLVRQRVGLGQLRLPRP